MHHFNILSLHISVLMCALQGVRIGNTTAGTLNIKLLTFLTVFHNVSMRQNSLGRYCNLSFLRKLANHCIVVTYNARFHKVGTL